MSAHAVLCPTQQQLAAFAAGKLDDAFSGEIEQHLGECPSCCQLLKLLPDDNTLVSLLRDPRAETTADDRSSPGTAPTILPAREQLTTPPGAGATEFVGEVCAAGTPALPDALAHHVRYRITGLLGRGGMGDVYQAYHRMMNRTVALKVISAQLVSNPAAIGRFHREVQAAARLSHPNIVAAYDAEQAGDVHFLVMEFVEGADLATLVQENGPLPVAQACEFIRQAAEGLQHAHSMGMVHRDIKPQNLMVAGGIVKILDFGLASFATESAAEQIEQSPDRHDAAGRAAHLTLMGSMMGTPDFMAPEQARDAHSADIRSDIYSLGCTLHFLLTGQPPFSGESVLDKVMAHVQREPKPLSECRPDISPGLETIVRRMMAKDPAERFQSPADVVAALKSLSVPQLLPRRRRSLAGPLIIAATLLAGFFLALAAAVIVVATDRGCLIIQSEVSDVKIVVKEDGKEIETIDLKTGSQMKWLPSGKYELALVGGDNDVKIDRSGFTMSRLGQAIVTARYSDEGRGVIRAFDTSEPTITRDGVEVADGGWKLTATSPRTVRLFDTPMPSMKPGPYFYRAKLKSENVTGRAYLEMWSRFPGEGEFFSRGFDKAIKGTNGWAEYEVPFYLKKGEQPDLVRLNVIIEGSGTVWIKDIEVRGRTAANDLPGGKAAVSDQQRLQGKWVAVSATFRGKELTAEQLARLSITLSGNRATLTDPNSGEAMEGTFTIDATRSPNHINFIAPDGKEQAPGIFEFDGERLKIAFVDSDYARPTGFQPAETPDHMTAVFKRVPGSAPAAVPPDGPVVPLEQDETQRAAVKAAEAYLAVMDEGRFGQLRDMLSSPAMRQTTREQMSQANQKIRDTFGKAQRRTLRKVQVFDVDSPALPKGRYASVQYQSDFERQNGLWETLLLMLDTDVQWRVNTYANTLEPPPLPEARPVPNTNAVPPPSRAGLLTNPPKLPEGGLPVGKNLIVDPSLEETPTGQLPKGWFAWLNDGPNFKCEVVEGGVTGKHCLQISGTGTRGVVFATSIPLDRTKRYALKGRVKVEGEAGTWAVIKLNYFNSTGWLGVDDRVGVTTSDFEWKLFEKTDAAEQYPAATLLVPTCHIEGYGTAWFDDLEVIAYDHEKLPENFDATHGKNNRMK
jgi:uncharacterized protein (TIGR03067 family)